MMTQQELEKYLWGAATALRGTIDAGDYKQYIFPLMFFKRISDVYDEEFENALAESDGDLEYAAFAENHNFLIPEGAHWNDVRETTTNIGLALQNAMRAITCSNPSPFPSRASLALCSRCWPTYSGLSCTAKTMSRTLSAARYHWSF